MLSLKVVSYITNKIKH